MRVELPKRYRLAAISACKVMGLEVGGVDMLQGRDGPKILEINSSPGLEGIERTSGVDVAGAIIAHAEKFLARRRKKRRMRRDDVVEGERRSARLRRDEALGPRSHQLGKNGSMVRRLRAGS